MKRSHILLRTTGARSLYEIATDAATSAAAAANSSTVRRIFRQALPALLMGVFHSQMAGSTAMTSNSSSSLGLNRSELSRISVCRMLLIMPRSIKVP